MYKQIVTRLVAVAALLIVAGASHADSSPPSFAIGLGFDVSRGAFGGDTTSSFVSAPVMIDWYPTTRLDFELSVPLYYQQTLKSVSANGSVVAKEAARGPMGGAGSSTMGGTSLSPGPVAESTNSATVSTSSGSGGGVLGNDYGMGDITLTGGYNLLEDGESSLLVRPTLYIKFPTADESKGFGTGKFDFGAGVALSKWLGSWQPFTEGRYIVQGAANDGSGALNFLTVDAGLAYRWTERLVTSVYARTGSALFEGTTAPLEARLKVSWRFGEKTYTDLYALKGFGDGSPDYGGGASLFVEF
jgi:hypothetical protein